MSPEVAGSNPAGGPAKATRVEVTKKKFARITWAPLWITHQHSKQQVQFEYRQAILALATLHALRRR